jgi:predicted dehydrogenase
VDQAHLDRELTHQAGKDVYVEKPFSYDLWEGQQMVSAARKYGRMVQVGTQSRSSAFLRRVFDGLQWKKRARSSFS